MLAPQSGRGHRGRVAAERQQTAGVYRNLGAAAGLGDPKRARESHAEAEHCPREFQGFRSMWD
jgi:hypothetical protein